MGNNAEIKIKLDTSQAERDAKKSSDRMRDSEEKGSKRKRSGGGRAGRSKGGGKAGGGRKGAGAAARGGAARGAAAGGAAGGAAAAAGTAAVALAGGLVIQQAVGKVLSETPILLSTLIKQGVMRDALLAVMPDITRDLVGSITSDAQFQQFQTDRLEEFGDDMAQKFSFELLTSQTARLDIGEILGPMARAGLPSGRLAKDDGSFTENLVRAERRRKFLERQQARRKFEGQVGVAIDFARAILGG